jgi:ubiquinone/menaquinone biosynthesis C-methylase UbiE
MTFREFWPLYLRAHRLPGTRVLQYFATFAGIVTAIEGIAAQEPLILLIGIALSYAIAVGTHRFIEGNRALVGADSFWEAIAALRMSWLALTGRLGAELKQLDRVVTDSPASCAIREVRWRFGGPVTRIALTLASGGGLVAGLIDLRDLTEPTELLPYPAIQLGAPIIAFTAALLVACAAQLTALRDVRILAAAGDSGAVAERSTPGIPDAPVPPSANETSLRYACLALLVLGLLAFGLAELAEHGFAASPGWYGATVPAIALLVIGLLRPAPRPSIRCEERAVRGPITRGLRVDGRAEWVDLLESLLSFGRRRSILKATLDAGNLRAGDHLIDVGCGTGELAMLAACSHICVTGIDATPDMIEIARRNARALGSRAQFEVGVAEALPISDSAVDAVVSSFFFHHLPSEVKREALREMWRVLAPGGRLVIADYGRPRGLVGLLASFPMRFNFHEYVRPQLGGELERMVQTEGLGKAEVARVFAGYIAVLRLVKPH